LTILSTAFGVKLISDNKNSEEGVGHSIGVMFVTGGVISAGISVPLFISSSKRKKERDKLLELYKERNLMTKHLLTLHIVYCLVQAYY
jgi:hypothetical protein